MTTRKELVEALRLRYRSAAFSDRIKILDEFVALTCYHRKHAIRGLRGEFNPATEVLQRNRVYDEAMAQAEAESGTIFVSIASYRDSECQVFG